MSYTKHILDYKSQIIIKHCFLPCIWYSEDLLIRPPRDPQKVGLNNKFLAKTI